MIASRAFHLALALLISATLVAAVFAPSIALGQEPPAQQTIAAPDSCSGLWNTFECYIWYPLISSVGTLLITLGVGILVVVGAVFDQFLNLLVVNFQSTITTLNILGGIQIAWQLFRDLTNVVIIGVFVFVAIMTILGSTEYGTKRLISRVLIVAILINFSLLFTRIMIEGTNFVSGQFARSMPNNALTAGVAQTFLEAFGIDGSITGTAALTYRVARETDSGWAALIYGLVVGSVFVVISLVFLYGIVIICARALLLIFMMITAPLAFASFLIPKWSNQAYIGWNSWWSNLLKAAMFGPILMVFLWIAMQIVSRAGATGAGTALAKLADDPSKMDINAWQQLIFLIIGTGILFVGIRASSSFASSIGGFNWATIASLAPITLGSRFVAAPLLRNRYGMPALERQLQLESELNKAKAGGQWSRAAILQKDYAQAAKVASRDFNAMNSNISKLVTKSLGVPTMLSGEKKLGGAAGIATAAAKEAAKELKGLPSKDAIKSSGEADTKKIIESTSGAIERLGKEQSALEARKGAIEQQRGTEQASIDNKLKKDEERLIENINKSSAGRTEQDKMNKTRQIAEADSVLKKQSSNISEAANRSSQEIKKLDEQLRWASADVINKQNEIVKKQFEAADAIKGIQDRTAEALATREKVIADSLPWLSRTGPTIELTSRQADKQSVRSIISSTRNRPPQK